MMVVLLALTAVVPLAAMLVRLVTLAALAAHGELGDLVEQLARVPRDVLERTQDRVELSRQLAKRLVAADLDLDQDSQEITDLLERAFVVMPFVVAHPGPTIPSDSASPCPIRRVSDGKTKVIAAPTTAQAPMISGNRS